MNKRSESIRKELFSNGAPVYAVLDGASIPDLLDQLYELLPPFECLWRGEPEPDMATVAPYLVELQPEGPLTEWLLDRGWGKHWGVFARTGLSMIEMKNHLRRFLTVYTEKGEPLLFRYYDPRVLRVFLPACNTGELKSFFGSIDQFVLEDETGGGLVRYRLKQDRLDHETVALKES